MQIKPPSVSIHFEFECSPSDAEVIAMDAKKILNEESSEAIGELSPEFKKMLEVLVMLPYN